MKGPVGGPDRRIRDLCVFLSLAIVVCLAAAVSAPAAAGGGSRSHAGASKRRARAADTVTIGSTLTNPADYPDPSTNFTAAQPFVPGRSQQDNESNQRDASRGGAGAGTVVPADGQITSFTVKGMAIHNPGLGPGDPRTLRNVRFQALIPQADGSVLVNITSGVNTLPDSGDPNQTNTFNVVNFCVHKGDVLAFNTEGGFDPSLYPNGVPFQVFHQGAGADTVAFFTKHNGTNNGARFTESTFPSLELLMRATEVTGDAASGLCDPTHLLLPQPVVGSDGSLGFKFEATEPETITGVAAFGNTPIPARLARSARRHHKKKSKVYATGSVDATGGPLPRPVTLMLEPTKRGRRKFKRQANINVTVDLAFRSSRSLGSTSKTKDFKVKVKGKGHKHH
jgi:hypothetical protein